MSIILAFILIGIGAVFLVISYFYYKSKQDYSNSSNLGTPEKKPWSHTWVYVLFEILAISLLVFVFWDKIALYFSDTPNLPDSSSFNFENSFFTTWDWTTFPWVQTHLGGVGDTIIWTLVILAIWWLVSTVLELLFSKKENRKIEYGVSGWLFFILLIGTGAYIFVSAIKNADPKASEAKVAKSSFVELKKFPRAVDGLELVVDMGVTQTAQIGLHMTNPRIHGNGKAFWACTEVIKPQVYADSLKFEVTPSTRGQYTNHIRLTKESRDMLIENGIMDIQVKFTQTLGAPKQSPCKHLT